MGHRFFWTNNLNLLHSTERVNQSDILEPASAAIICCISLSFFYYRSLYIFRDSFFFPSPKNNSYLTFLFAPIFDIQKIVGKKLFLQISSFYTLRYWLRFYIDWKNNDGVFSAI